MLTAVLAVAVLALLPAATGSTGCSDSALATGGCGVANDGTTLTITGTQEQPGTSTDDSTSDRGDADPPADPSRRTPSDLCSPLGSRVGNCATAPVLPTVGVVPSITISDLEQFAPQATTTAAEPGDIGIAGMPTNFIAVAAEQTRTGTILGVPITVRFTPVAYDYRYGDGSTATLEAAGQTWAVLGQAQFTPTPTSHTYRNRGTYLADVDVRYTAEVDLGSGWFPIDGQLTTDGPAREIHILEARTALVAHTCLEHPAAAGC